MAQDRIHWATAVQAPSPSRETCADYAFSPNFNAPLPEDGGNLLVAPGDCNDDDDVNAIREALDEGDSVEYEKFRKELGF